MELLESTVASAAPLPAPAASPSDSLRNSARLEFQAAMQLLADRAAFLTAADGVAIAVLEDGKFVYCVAIGNRVPKVGSVADFIPRDSTGLRLIVPIKCTEEAAGFFELAGKRPFSDQDSQQVVRLADLAAVAIEHRRAGERANAETWEQLQASLAPPQWHMPPAADLPQAPREPLPEKIAVGAQSCASCGFPVSPGRNLCVECELKSDSPVVASGELFTLQNQESWISEHGYTVASLVVSALAAAIIFWLRH